ncbi:lytic transglycosylase domain-containing protein [Nocardia inohanensis]|uniref:lytic transglycosylase domain-containing protein n=1 Tax=Nocardia inohanensis TaxID=209246 RepID=UPI001FE1537A|nr:lytic murein transglycosylase [Nocardia inohanensis]
MTASALLIAGLVTAGSATNTAVHTAAPQTAPEALLAAAASNTGAVAEVPADQTVGLVPAAAEAPRKLSALTPPSDGSPLFGGTVPLQNIALPGGSGALGIPEIVLAAYRNAELALQSSTPGCGLPWNLLAGIGRIESGHASNGRTDAAGTSITPIFGPALDGTLPGNEVIKASDGGFVRAVGPMQFLPSTWANYAADGNGDGVADPHNVFDAALAAGKYLCSGGLDLRDTAQQLKAVLRYNNSMTYAAQVLSWSNAYKTGGAPAPVAISAELVQPGSLPSAGDYSAASATIPTTTEAPVATTTVAPQTPTQVMITIPGLPPIPCGIFCPAPQTTQPANPCEQAAVSQDKPEQAAKENETGQGEGAAQNGETQTFGPDGKPVQEQAKCTPATQEQPAQQQAQQPQEQAAPAPETTQEAQAAPAPEAAPVTTTANPGITLPFGITIPVPAPAQ